MYVINNTIPIPIFIDSYHFHYYFPCGLTPLYYYSKLASQFTAMEVRNSNFSVFIDLFTPNTYIMVVMSEPNIRKLINQYKYFYMLVESSIFMFSFRSSFIKHKECSKTL